PRTEAAAPAFLITVAWVVRFIGIIRQPSNQTYSDCLIHRRYRTTFEPNAQRLSDSSVLSDNHRTERAADVRFIDVIGQPSNIRSK
ncbi:MAG: hypothetical protein WAQ45_05025, partial [Trichococcus flocculiformis]